MAGLAGSCVDLFFAEPAWPRSCVDLFFAAGAGLAGTCVDFSRGRLKAPIQLDFVRVWHGNIAQRAPRPAEPQLGPSEATKDRVLVFFRGPAWRGSCGVFFAGRPGEDRVLVFFRRAAWPGSCVGLFFAARPARDRVLIYFPRSQPGRIMC